MASSLPGVHIEEWCFLHLVTSLFFKGLEVKPEGVRGLEGGFILVQHILTYVDALEFQRLVICE